MFGRFLELSLITRDITASVQFYERLGFFQLTTSDAIDHPYGVLSDGRIHLGLHQRQAPAPCLTFVRPGLVQHADTLQHAGIQPVARRLGDEDLNELQLRAPCGQAVALLEARTYSPAARAQSSPGSAQTSACGYFVHYSMPVDDVETERRFWETGGFVVLDSTDLPYPHWPVTCDTVDLAFHSRRTFDAPLLLFETDDLPGYLAQLRAWDVSVSPDLPRGLSKRRGAMIEAPEGTLLLVTGAHEHAPAARATPAS